MSRPFLMSLSGPDQPQAPSEGLILSHSDFLSVSAVLLHGRAVFEIINVTHAEPSDAAALRRFRRHMYQPLVLRALICNNRVNISWTTANRDKPHCLAPIVGPL